MLTRREIASIDLILLGWLGAIAVVGSVFPVDGDVGLLALPTRYFAEVGGIACTSFLIGILLRYRPTECRGHGERPEFHRVSDVSRHLNLDAEWEKGLLGRVWLP